MADPVTPPAPVTVTPKARADSKTYVVNGLAILFSLLFVGFLTYKNGGVPLTPEAITGYAVAINSAVNLFLRENTSAPLLPLTSK